MKDKMVYDIIGDVHGRAGKLHELLIRLGYRFSSPNFYEPPAGHMAVFLGDIIDPKPEHGQQGGVWSVLEMVKRMCDRGDAICLMGNHELNAIYYHSQGPDGRWLRIRGSKNRAMHQGTLNDYLDHDDPEGEWRQIWLPWLKRLPFYVDFGGFRAVHAMWHDGMIVRIAGRSLDDPDFFLAAADKHRPEGEALEMLLKGMEVDLPEGVFHHDAAGNRRRRLRVRWWQREQPGISYRQLAFPHNAQLPADPVPDNVLGDIPAYPADAPPVFFGHYFKPGDSSLVPEAHNVACLDFSAAADGPLVAYRWQGESCILPEHFVAVHHVEPVRQFVFPPGVWRQHLRKCQREEREDYLRLMARVKRQGGHA